MLGRVAGQSCWAEVLGRVAGRRCWAELPGGVAGRRCWAEVLGRTRMVNMAQIEKTKRELRLSNMAILMMIVLFILFQKQTTYIGFRGARSACTLCYLFSVMIPEEGAARWLPGKCGEMRGNAFCPQHTRSMIA